MRSWTVRTESGILYYIELFSVNNAVKVRYVLLFKKIVKMVVINNSF